MVIPYRSLSLLVLGVWLGGSVAVDIAVSQNFQTVDRFLAAPGDSRTSAQLSAIGRVPERAILRRNAAEENNWLFLNWERAELAIGGMLLVLCRIGQQRQKMKITGSVALLAIVAAEHFLLTPDIVSLGRIVDGLTAADPRYRTFWILHGFYSGLDILKMVVIFGIGVRAAFLRPDTGSLREEAWQRRHQVVAE